MADRDRIVMFDFDLDVVRWDGGARVEVEDEDKFELHTVSSDIRTKRSFRRRPPPTGSLRRSIRKPRHLTLSRLRRAV